MDRPLLRKVDRIPLARDDEALLVLRDPLDVAEPLAIDGDFAPVLDLLDGAHTLAQVRQSLLMGSGLDVPLADLKAFVRELGQAALLDDDLFRARWSQIHEAFIAGTERSATLAGLLYPADPDRLLAELHSVLGGSPTLRSPHGPPWGMLVPHGPPGLVAPALVPALAHVDRETPPDVVVLLGADHHPGLLPLTLADKGYRTPLGLAAPALPEIGALARRVPWLTREAIRHRSAHSLEWLVLYLQFHFGSRMPPIVPVLCGQAVWSKQVLHDGVDEFAVALEAVCDGARVLVCAAAELTHAGPAYGRPAPDQGDKDRLAARDRAILACMTRGRTAQMFEHAAQLPAQGPPSGMGVLATLAQCLPVGAQVEPLHYELARAEAGQEGWIGLGSLVIHAP